MIGPDTLAPRVSRPPWERDPGEVSALWRQNRMMVWPPTRFSAAWQRRIIPEVYRGSRIHRGSWPVGIMVESPEGISRSADISQTPDALTCTQMEAIHLEVRRWHQRPDGIEWGVREHSLADGERILSWEVEALRIDWRDGSP